MKNLSKIFLLLQLGLFFGCSDPDNGSQDPEPLYWEKVSAGEQHVIAIRSDGTLWAWGANAAGQIGDGTTEYRFLPVQIGTDENWVEISAGGYHSMALTADKKLWVWGANYSGQVGDGTEQNRTTPTLIGNDTWNSISAGHLFSTALRSDGTIWAWGLDIYGAVGDPEWDPYVGVTSPKKVGTDTDWATVIAGSHFVVARKSNGAVWGWGNNGDGELGIDVTDDTYMFQTPVSATNVPSSGWEKIVCGQHTLGLKTNGKLYGWGDNSMGQLGHGNTISTSVPVQIGTATWKFVSAGTINSAGIKTDGTLWTWGSNNYGSLGIGNDNDQQAPVQVGTDNNWKAVSISISNGFAIKEDNSLWGWGYMIDSSAPVLIPCPQ